MLVLLVVVMNVSFIKKNPGRCKSFELEGRTLYETPVRPASPKRGNALYVDGVVFHERRSATARYTATTKEIRANKSEVTPSATTTRPFTP